jgi:hypothetical protein
MTQGKLALAAQYLILSKELFLGKANYSSLMEPFIETFSLNSRWKKFFETKEENNWNFIVILSVRLF